MSRNRSRGYVFTLNNYTPAEENKLKGVCETDGVRYIVFGHEVAPTTGTPHLQGFLLFEQQTAFSTVKKIIPRANIQPQKGSDFQASDYCKKDNDFFEAGNPPRQGKRYDIHDAVDSIMDGTLTTTDIVLNDPNLYVRAFRAFDRVQAIRIARTTNVVREDQRRTFWYFGEAGVGKSRRVFNLLKDESYYLYPYDGDWMDSYEGQKNIYFDDFRGQVPYNALLRMTDPWYNSYQCRRRGTVPYPCISDRVLITSALPPWTVYAGVLSRDDNISQLFRRIKVIKLFSDGTEKEITFETYSNSA